MELKQCPICGNNFKIKPSEHNKIFCNIECKKKHTKLINTKQCSQCGKDYVPNKKTSKYCSRECQHDASRTLKKTFNCTECNKTFKEKSNTINKFCSRECSFANLNKNKLSNVLTSKELKLRHAIRNKAHSLLHEIKCNYCSKKFYSKPTRKYCSDICSKKKLARDSALRNGYKINRICNICNKEFNYLDNIHDNQCSSKCYEDHKINQKKKNRSPSQKHKQRAKRLNAKYESGITIKKLIVRDGNKCIICNKRVLDINVSGYHKDNATIGHIISMANGGSHTWSNIQLECMECNTKKGARNGGQLRLF